jgi:protocatechuate 3,4-dioxygenase alpha subunit
VLPNADGERIRLEGIVYDGERVPVPDAVIEIWQADHRGRYHYRLDEGSTPNDGAFVGFGRCGTRADGSYAFETVMPGAVPFDEARQQASHISMAIFARGLLNHLFTRAYFEGDPANDEDPVLKRVPISRRPTLIARRTTPSEHAVYTFDVVLQGESETVFFDFEGRGE